MNLKPGGVLWHHFQRSCLVSVATTIMGFQAATFVIFLYSVVENSWHNAIPLQRFSGLLVTYGRGLFWLHLRTLSEVVESSCALCLPSSSDVGCFSPQSSFLAEGTLLLSLFLGWRFYNSYLQSIVLSGVYFSWTFLRWSSFVWCFPSPSASSPRSNHESSHDDPPLTVRVSDYFLRCHGTFVATLSFHYGKLTVQFSQPIAKKMSSLNDPLRLPLNGRWDELFCPTNKQTNRINYLLGWTLTTVYRCKVRHLYVHRKSRWNGKKLSILKTS